MTNHKPRVPRFDDGAYAGSDFADQKRANPRKTMQLCTQIRRAIELVLMDAANDDVLEDVIVEEVKPTPDPGRLWVNFAAGERAVAAGRTQVVAKLEGLRAAVIAEVARSINRRKVPDLAFEVTQQRVEANNPAPPA